MRSLEDIQHLDDALALRQLIKYLESLYAESKSNIATALLEEPGQEYVHKGATLKIKTRAKYNYKPIQEITDAANNLKALKATYKDQCHSGDTTYYEVEYTGGDEALLHWQSEAENLLGDIHGLASRVMGLEE